MHFINPLLISVVLMLCSLTQAFAETPTNLIIEHGPRNSKKIALTFDACPTGKADEYDEQVIDILLQKQVPATLFMSGRWVEKNVEKAKFLASKPQFEIANHTYFHLHLLEKSDDRIIREFRNSQAEIRKVTGKKPRYFRPPFGEVNEHVAELAKKAGLITIQYDIASGDPDPELSPKRIARILLHDAQGGSIIVLHMNRNGKHTAEFLPEVIDGLRKKGFTLVTVGEMLKQEGRSKR